MGWLLVRRKRRGGRGSRCDLAHVLGSTCASGGPGATPGGPRRLGGPAHADVFPEGEFFTYVLTGLAAGELAATASNATERREYVDLVERSLKAASTKAVRVRFGDIPALVGGIFYRDWTLLLETYLAAVDDGSGRAAEYSARATIDAQAITDAVNQSCRGFSWAGPEFSSCAPALLPDDVQGKRPAD